jgi:RNA polymerase sigma-70 factor (ECF subfamily)
MWATDQTTGSEPAIADGDWVREAFHQHQAALVSYVEHLLGDLDLARDVVQEAFLRLCREDDPGLRERVAPWLYTVCRRRALDLLRKERRMQPMDDTQTGRWASGDPTPAAAAETNEQAGRAARLLQRLPANQREVVVLKFQHALSYREISEVTGLSVSNVGFLLHTALKTLRRWLDPEPVASPPHRRSP